MEKNVDGIINQMNRMTYSFNSFKIIAIVSVVSAVIAAVASVAIFTVKLSEIQSQIYVLDEGATFSATVRDAAITKEDEIRHQVEMFHRFFFNIPPSTDMIKRNLEEAFELADNSAYEYYNDLQETGFYQRLTQSQSYQQIDIESVSIDMSVYPYAVSVSAYQYITRESNMSKFSLKTRCLVTNSVRSSKNLHGLMINRFEVVENNLIETRKR